MKNILKRLGLIALLTVYVTAFTTPVAHAYIDPSTTTYLIQAIAGIAVAVGSVAIIVWRKAKKKIKDKMGVDLDKNKEQEEAFQVNPVEKKEP